MSEAGRWPDTIGTYHGDLNWTELRYYRLRCEFSNNAGAVPRKNLFRVHHDHWKRLFEKADCERAGCIPVIWNSNTTFIRGRPVIDVYWSNVIQFATTALQLKICTAANEKTVFTTSQLNNLTICQPSGRFSLKRPGNVSACIILECFVL